MEKFTAMIEKFLLPTATKLGSNKYLRAISGGFASLMPIIMVGAIAALLSGLNIAPYQAFIADTGIKAMIGWVTACTTNMFALYGVFLIAKNMAEDLECASHSVLVAIIALFVFLLLIPIGVSGKTEGGEMVVIAGAISVTYFGAPGLFTAMILGILVPQIYNLFVKHNIVLKMPEGVPPQIATAFSAVIPAGAIAVLFAIIRFAVSLTSFGTVNDLIYGLLKAPLSALTASPVTFALLLVLCNLLWFFGIHGGMVTVPFLTILYTAANLENLDALASGAALPNLLTQTWWFGYGNMGGSGGIIGLAILMAFYAKSQRYKTLGKIALVPAIVNVSEPCVFGLPMVLNVLMFIPMVFVPLINFGLSYLLTVLGVLPYLNGMTITTGTPAVMSGFLAGGWRAGLWQVVLIVIQVLGYFPFFRMMDRQALAEEKNEQAVANG